MFSSRLEWSLAPNRLSEILDAKRQAAAEILDLTESNPTRAGLVYPPGLTHSLAGGESLIYEPQAAGLRQAREAVAGYYAGAGRPIDAARILLTTSTSDSYGYLFKLLCDPGDEILVPRPSYPLFGFLASLESVRVVPYPLVYHGRWSMDLDALERAITPRTRAIVVVNPNNPTGSFLKRNEWAVLGGLAGSRGLAVIADEVFADYGHADDPERVTSLVGLDEAASFSLSGLSKVSALPQMKLGWIVVNGDQAFRHQALERLELIADTYLAVSTPIQHAAAGMLEARFGLQRQIRERVSLNLARLRGAIAADSPCRVLNVEGGWYATLQVPRLRTEEALVEGLLEEENVLVQPGYFYDFDGEGYLVLSLLTAPDVFARGLGVVLAGACRDPRS
ncbi:MAG: pyridoxal phosphate-dependent aminotransferase [Acidobacteria bacterium]|nr:pyridoxal phosphate-dependent aminotransferase [Acidobacteriota bacterium]